VTREVTTPEIARAGRDNPQETEATEDLDLPEEMIEEDPQDLQEEVMTMVGVAGTIEIVTADPTETESTDLVMKAEEIGEETTPEMAAGTEEAEMTQETDAATEMSLEAEVTQEEEEIDTVEMEALIRKTEECPLSQERREETTDQRAEILTDAPREDLLDPSREEMRSLPTDLIMMTRSLRDADHHPTELRLITLTKSLRKHQRRLKLPRQRTLSTFEGPGEQIFNQRNCMRRITKCVKWKCSIKIFN
jgi:hypothetical protein